MENLSFENYDIKTKKLVLKSCISEFIYKTGKLKNKFIDKSTNSKN